MQPLIVNRSTFLMPTMWSSKGTNWCRASIIGFFVLLPLALGGCATSGEGAAGSTPQRTFILPLSDEASTADGAAFTGDGMYFRKEMPSHADWRPMEFYFKDCAEAGSGSYYSKTAYECSSR